MRSDLPQGEIDQPREVQGNDRILACQSESPGYAFVMETSGPSDELRRWAECWQVAGEFLEEVKCHDLAQMDEAAAQRSIQLLSSDERLWFDDQAPSGLVEQQRLFQKLAPR
ncbi:MAG TPA: hypothetical protein PLX89_00095 [Verrucomicrobiota bacterium]|nr:hypothetical protein [Verrucomicrobiales bacterium]HRI11377.1 hypothetical protein [Verrucomicrobiota bacterium]